MVVKKTTVKKGSSIKVGKLKLNKETVKNLTKAEAKKVKGGVYHVPVPPPTTKGHQGC